MKIFITYQTNEQLNELLNLKKEIDDESISFYFIDSMSFKGKKQANRLKHTWGARKDPFAIVIDNNKAIAAFYTESKKDVISELTNYLINKINDTKC